jgi:hypothetical protein
MTHVVPIPEKHRNAHDSLDHPKNAHECIGEEIDPVFQFLEE